MKKFINHMIFFFIILSILIFSVVFFSNKTIDNSNVFKLSSKIQNLILGHSHSEGAFNDSLILNTKNLSQSGELYFYTYLKIKKIVSENQKIKTIFMEFTNNQITMDMEKWTYSQEQILNRVPKYAPVMNLNDFEYLASKNPLAIFKSLPIILKKNVNFLIHQQNNFISENDWGGFYKNKRSQIDSLLLQKKLGKLNHVDVSKFTNINLNYLLKIVDYCEQNNIKIVLVRSPLHKSYEGIENEILYQNVLKSQLKNIDFVDFKNFKLENSEYFDFEHLNYKGARKFSIFFNHLLEKGLLNKPNKQEFIDQEMKKLALIK